MLSGYLSSVGNVAVGKRRFMLHTEVNIFIQGCVQHIFTGARCSSVVGAFTHGAMGVSDRSFMVGPIELFLNPASAPRLVYVLSCLWDDPYKITLAANRKE